jgi:tRNA-dihydrouridine synthase A
MMDWTDRHCRYLHRLMSRHALLYTEMVTAAAVVHGDPDVLLRHDPSEHPVAVQLGGSDPDELARATRIASSAGFDEVNLNVGCPSDRVQSGAFGAILMKSPELVADCVAAMREATQVEVTVKCRIGVDDQEPRVVLPEFLDGIRKAGVRRVTIHARKAWLDGLSPKENRTIPPLDYALVAEMKAAFPDLHVSLNGGIESLEQVETALAAGMDGVMVGRTAYHTPARVLLEADHRIWGEPPSGNTSHDIVRQMLPYIEAHLSEGGRLNSVTRHMLGLFSGCPGARAWRRMLSEGAHKDGAGTALIEAALAQVPEGALSAAV